MAENYKPIIATLHGADLDNVLLVHTLDELKPIQPSYSDKVIFDFQTHKFYYIENGQNIKPMLEVSNTTQYYDTKDNFPLPGDPDITYVDKSTQVKYAWTNNGPQTYWKYLGYWYSDLPKDVTASMMPEGMLVIPGSVDYRNGYNVYTLTEVGDDKQFHQVQNIRVANQILQTDDLGRYKDTAQIVDQLVNTRIYLPTPGYTYLGQYYITIVRSDKSFGPVGLYNGNYPECSMFRPAWKCCEGGYIQIS